MSDDTLVLAQASGVALYDRGARWLIVDRGTQWAYTVGFVLGLMTLIPGGFGVLQLALALGGGGILVLGLVMTAVAAASAVGLWRIIVHVRRRAALPPEQATVVAVIDFGAAAFCDGAGRPLAPLASVRFGRKVQLTSSSPVLEARWPDGSLTLVAGNPFAGGVDAIEEALRTRGLSVG